MSTVFLNPRQQKKAQELEWARLIPGQSPTFRKAARKPPRSVKPVSLERRLDVVRECGADLPERTLDFLVPGPLRRRTALKWLRSMAADWVLVGLSWLIMGALLVPLRVLFPWVRSFRYDAGSPASLMGYTEGLHKEHFNLRARARILAKSVLWATAVLCLAYELQGASWIIGGLFCATGVLEFAALWTWRWWSGGRDRSARKRADARNVLIVGAGGIGQRVASYIEHHPAIGRTVCGFLDDDRPLGNEVIGRIADLARMARKGFVDEVILAGPRNSDVTRWVLDEARRLRLDVEIVPDLFGCNPVGHEVERVSGLPVICLNVERLPAAGLALKRLADVFGAALALTILSPVLIVIAILIKLDSPGPVLYCASRAGRKGRLFHCYKFRTMVSNADELKEHLRQNNERSGPFFKMTGDPRITRLGHYLRRYSLDELPQLWNVMKGEMSLVGPRPHPLDDVASYEIEHLARLDVTPGITGLWQVTARRDPSFRRGMELDREYIRTWSLGLDVRILLRTFRAVVCGSGQ